MASDFNNPETVTDAQNVDAPEGNGNVNPDVVQLKDVLSDALGRQFKDDQAALKAVKETFSYVGRVGKYQKAIESVKSHRGFGSDDEAVKYIMDELNKPEATAKPDTGDLANKINSLENALSQAQFYNEHPEYKPHKDLIAKFGTNPADVVSTDEFKGLFAKLEKADEVEKSRSVIHSNPRLGAVNDKMGQARDALKAGDGSQAAKLAIDAVNEAYQ